MVKKPVHNDADKPDQFDFCKITNEQLKALGLTLAEVNLLDPNKLIEIYELTFSVMNPDEYYFLQIEEEYGSLDETAEEIKRKNQAWKIRYAIAYRLPELLAWQRYKGKDISKYVEWLNKQLVRTFPKPKEQEKNELNFWEWVLFKLICGIGDIFFSLGPTRLDSEILGEFLYSMHYYEVFDEKTWKYVIKMQGHLTNIGYLKSILLISKIYEKLCPADLRKYLEREATKKKSGVERQNGFIEAAPYILKGKRLKIVEPPYSIGIAVEE